jgi:transposase
MQTITTIGLDIAKSVFQVHGVDAAGAVVIRRQLKRRSVLAFFQKLPSCLVGIEACASSHHWSRELQALGHTVRLMPPAYVKPYVKRQKNDLADAEAICEAVTRANMRFVLTKTPEQQSGLVLHRARHLFIRQQTAVINAIRADLAEFGIVAPVGRHGVEELLNVVADPNDKRVPEMARACLLAFGAQLRGIKEQIPEFDRPIRAWHRSNEMSMSLDEAPGVGPVLATALVAAVADPKSFRSGRNFSAWIGIVPKQHSSGGKNRLGNPPKWKRTRNGRFDYRDGYAMFTEFIKWSFYGVFTVKQQEDGRWVATRCTEALLQNGRTATFPTAEIARHVVDLHERDGVGNYPALNDGFSWDDPDFKSQRSED